MVSCFPRFVGAQHCFVGTVVKVHTQHDYKLGASESGATLALFGSVLWVDSRYIDDDTFLPMQVSLINQSEISLPRKFTIQILEFLEKELRSEAPHLRMAELTVVFLKSGPAKKLNKTFRGRDYATDILSFSSGVKPRKLTAEHFFPFGELVLCPQVLKKQAKEHGLSFKAEFAYMLIHGVLHLLGYDHEGEGASAKRKARVMFAVQDQLFDRLRKKYDF